LNKDLFFTYFCPQYKKKSIQIMKKSIALAALVAVSSLFIIGCSKDDTEAPIISLIGSNPFQLEMLQTYSEPGATADDNEDGDISSSINVDASEIENRLPGTYNVYYSVSDAAGNPADAIREVVVFATNGALAKTYNVVDSVFTTSGIFVPPVFSYTQTLTASGSDVNSYSLFANYTGLTPAITTTVNGNGTITLGSQTATAGNGDSHTFSGTAQVTTGGFRLVYTDVNNTVSATANGRAYYTRQ
jgi:hypothetical protein